MCMSVRKAELWNKLGALKLCSYNHLKTHANKFLFLMYKVVIGQGCLFRNLC